LAPTKEGLGRSIGPILGPDQRVNPQSVDERGVRQINHDGRHSLVVTMRRDVLDNRPAHRKIDVSSYPDTGRRPAER
jgi:hypothetical protein